MEKKTILSVKNLQKIYKKNGSQQTKAIENLNLEVKEGEIFGLLGPNGAGKSTFINILAGLVLKTSGEVNVWGFDIDKNPRQVRASIGIVPQELNLDPFFGPRKLLELQAGLYGVKKKDRITDTILKMVSLDNQADSYSRGLSGGMKRRLMIAKALVHQPPIVILDEPTAGVDIELRREMWDFLKEINENGTTIILTTHYLEEAEQLCKNIAIIDHGELIENTSMKDLLRRLDVQGFLLDIDQSLDNPPSIDNFQISLEDSNTLNVAIKKDQSINELFDQLSDQGINVSSMRNESNRLEEMFIEMVKKN